MAQSRYFTNFPTITYQGTQALDITERVVFLNNALKNPYLFYPYNIADDERADQFCNRYYKDSYKSWILYLSNQITDPYYEWYISQETFNEFLNVKYKSVNVDCPIQGYQLAQQKVKNYENNWYSSQNISVSQYNSLPATVLKYWQPIYGFNNAVIAYERTKNSITINTNGIRSYYVSNTNFIKDEVCNVVFSDSSSGSGQVLSVIKNTLYLQHVSGSTVSNTNLGGYIYGQESSVNTIFSNSSLIVDNLLPEEVTYWSPVYCYDYENAKNEYNNTIKVLDSAYSANVANGLKALLK